MSMILACTKQHFSGTASGLRANGAASQRRREALGLASSRRQRRSFLTSRPPDLGGRRIHRVARSPESSQRSGEWPTSLGLTARAIDASEVGVFTLPSAGCGDLVAVELVAVYVRARLADEEAVVAVYVRRLADDEAVVADPERVVGLP